MSKPPSRQKYAVVFIVIASICLVIIGVGIYGSINLVREVFVELPATAKAQELATEEAKRNARATQERYATNTARDISDEGTAKAQELATEEAKRNARATQERYVTNTARAISDEGTATVEAVTATARAGWSVVHFDPFNFYFWGGWPAGEESDTFATVDYDIDNGKYYLEITAKEYVNWRVWSNVHVGSEFELKVDVQNKTGLSRDAYGMAFREKDGDFYVFLINDITLLYRVSMMKDGAWYSLIQPISTDAIKPREINTLEVEAYGNHLFFYINDQFVGEAIDDALKSGRAGLCVDLPAGHEGVFVFDNFTLSAPPD